MKAPLILLTVATLSTASVALAEPSQVFTFNDKGESVKSHTGSTPEDADKAQDQSAAADAPDESADMAPKDPAQRRLYQDMLNKAKTSGDPDDLPSPAKVAQEAEHDAAQDNQAGPDADPESDGEAVAKGGADTRPVAKPRAAPARHENTGLRMMALANSKRLDFMADRLDTMAPASIEPTLSKRIDDVRHDLDVVRNAPNAQANQERIDALSRKVNLSEEKRENIRAALSDVAYVVGRGQQSISDRSDALADIQDAAESDQADDQKPIQVPLRQIDHDQESANGRADVLTKKLMKNRRQIDEIDGRISQRSKTLDASMAELTQLVATGRQGMIDGMSDVLEQRDERIDRLADKVEALESTNAQWKGEIKNLARAADVRDQHEAVDARIKQIQANFNERLTTLTQKYDKRLSQMKRRVTRAENSADADQTRLAMRYSPAEHKASGYDVQVILPVGYKDAVRP